MNENNSAVSEQIRTIIGAAVSKLSILYPEATDAYYFVLGKDGSHIFSKTYEEHLAAMQSTEQNISVDDSAIENQDSLKQ